MFDSTQFYSISRNGLNTSTHTYIAYHITANYYCATNIFNDIDNDSVF